MMSSNGNIFRATGHLCGEFTGHRWIPRTKASAAELWCFFYHRLNKRLGKQSWVGWFETSSRSLWRHCNDNCRLACRKISLLLDLCNSSLSHIHYSDVIMSAMASQITGVSIVCSTVCSGAHKKTSKLRVTCLYEGNPSMIGGFLLKRASNTENVSLWWRHHAKMYCSSMTKTRN